MADTAKTMYTRIAQIALSQTQWASNDYKDKILLKGEIGYDTTNNKIKIGDGTKKWAELSWVSPDYTLPIATTSELGGIKSSATAGDVKVNSTTGIATVDDVVASTSGAGGSHGLMTAAQAEKLAGVATGAQVNVLEGVSFKGSGESQYSDLTISNKKAQLDLSGYALKSEISAALNFRGSATGTQLKNATIDGAGGTLKVESGDVYTCSSDDLTGTFKFHKDLEYAASVSGSTVTWTELGNWIDLSGYVQTSRKINGEALSSDVTLDGADIDLSSGYAIASTAAKPAAGDSIDTAVGKVQKEIDVLNGDASTAGSVAKTVNDAITVSGITVNGTAQTLTNKTIPFATGTTNGTIKVNGVEVAVAGLGDNAYTSTAFVPQTTKVNGTALSGDVTLDGADIKLDGYTKASASAAIAATDTINAALGKLEYKVDSATSGTVTSVGLSLPNMFTVTGSPVTSSGTLTATLAAQAKNKVFAGPATGNNAAPTFRDLVEADIPTLSQSKITDLSTDLSAKADKVTGATNGNFAGLDANGNLTDSGSKASDFATSAQGSKADSAVQSVTGDTYVSATTTNHAVTLATSSKVVTTDDYVLIQCTLDGVPSGS